MSCSASYLPFILYPSPMNLRLLQEAEHNVRKKEPCLLALLCWGICLAGLILRKAGWSALGQACTRAMTFAWARQHQQQLGDMSASGKKICYTRPARAPPGRVAGASLGGLWAPSAQLRASRRTARALPRHFLRRAA